MSGVEVPSCDRFSRNALAVTVTLDPIPTKMRLNKPLDDAHQSVMDGRPAGRDVPWGASVTM